jgi:hypothetical protein
LRGVRLAVGTCSDALVEWAIVLQGDFERAADARGFQSALRIDSTKRTHQCPVAYLKVTVSSDNTAERKPP